MTGYFQSLHKYVLQVLCLKEINLYKVTFRMKWAILTYTFLLWIDTGMISLSKKPDFWACSHFNWDCKAKSSRISLDRSHFFAMFSAVMTHLSFVSLINFYWWKVWSNVNLFNQSYFLTHLYIAILKYYLPVQPIWYLLNTSVRPSVIMVSWNETSPNLTPFLIWAVCVAC